MTTESELEGILNDLRSTQLSWSSSAPMNNMRCIDMGSQASMDVFGSFLTAAADVCLGQAVRESIPEATFYAWVNFQGVQLRFSVAPCGPDALPFGVPIELVPTAAELIEPYLDSHRDMMSRKDFEAGFLAEPGQPKSPEPPRIVEVWARSYDDAV